MRKREWALLILSLCVLLSALVWILSNRSASIDDDANTDNRNALDASSTFPQQSKVVIQPKDQEPLRTNTDMDAPKQTGESGRKTHGVPPRLVSDASELKFQTLESTLDEWARLVGIEYDRLIKEGVEEIVAQMRARQNVTDILINGHLPDFASSYVFFQDELTMENSSTMALLVRSGRGSPELLHNAVRLPNGKIYFLERNSEIVVRYQAQASLTEEGKLQLKRLKQQERDLLAKQRQIETPDDIAALSRQLKELRVEIESMENLMPAELTFNFWYGDREHPDFKKIEMDLGLIEPSN